MESNPLVAWLERHQVILYVVAIAGGAVAGGFTPGSQRVEAAINPAIALLLLATFLAVPSPRSVRPSKMSVPGGTGAPELRAGAHRGLRGVTICGS